MKMHAMAVWGASRPGVLLLALIGLLAGCSGDEQLARTGGGGTGLATTVGTVTGFGSSIVDGEGWDDRRAWIELERSPVLGVVSTEVRLGQRVRVEYAARGIADRITVEPEVIGRVSEVTAAASPPQFKVAGQVVRVNSDPAAGPVTLFDGVPGVGALQVDDVVEVHGTPRFDAALDHYVVMASRVERLVALPAGLVRIGGVVEANNAVQRSFRLGELTVSATASTVVVPANRAVANGQRVTVWSDDPLGTSGSGPTLTADFIRVAEHSTGNGARSEVSGVISRFDAGASTFDVGGIAVNARAANIVPASQSLAEGRYVIASGSFDATGVLQATRVRIRNAGVTDIEVELKGTITNFTSATDFRVRGVGVNAGGVNARPGCPSTGLANGLYVEIEGGLGASDGRVEAQSVRCTSPGAGRVITIEGVASSVDLTGRSFILTAAGSSARSVQWTPVTHFAGLNADTLAGTAVTVDGYEEGRGFIATKVRRY
jgi:hypothetical protein